MENIENPLISFWPIVQPLSPAHSLRRTRIWRAYPSCFFGSPLHGDGFVEMRNEQTLKDQVNDWEGHTPSGPYWPTGS